MDTLKLLIVEDDIDMQLFYEDSLKEFQFVTDKVRSAEEAIEKFKKNTYDLVILDWKLPQMSGPDFCQWIRQKAEGGPYVLMITVNKGMQHLHELLKAGCDDYLQKPLDKSQLIIRAKVAVNDINHRKAQKKAETELNEMRIYMRTVLDSLMVGTVLVDANGKILYFNDKSSVITQKTLKKGENFADCLPVTQENRKAIKIWLDAKGNSGKFTVSLNTTTDCWLEIELYNSLDSPDQYIIHIKDITEIMLLKLGRQKKDGYNLIGESSAIIEIRRQLEILADGDWNVLIEGETGTGKELAAREIHELSPRRDKIFLTVNCAGLTETLASSILFGHKKGSFTGALSDHKGFFEAAEGGTLFLDEIGDISAGLQVLLLRALELKEITRIGENIPRKVDVRIVTATNKDLTQEVEQGRFRMDLYYRLNSARVVLPPLRDRREDIPLLIDYFLHQHSIQYSSVYYRVNSEAMKILMNYPWPGNVRELKSVIQFAAVQAAGGWITPDELPVDLKDQGRQRWINVVNNDDESVRIVKALKASGNNISKAALLLGISRATLYRKIKRYDIH